MENKILCPLVEKDIEIGDCVVVSDCAAGLMKESVIEKRFCIKKDWREICKACKYFKQ